MILVAIIAAKSKPFVVHLNVLSYNNYWEVSFCKSSQSLILVAIIAAKSKPFVVHLNVLSYNNCPSIGRYLFVNPVR